ncbi:Terpenoid cyclases/protein prenyltransferase alpha-alpha toroid [Penicillium occitanis (nom. inval.)]|nr:Terpenoid cyclases/protein prenyltransferase alpha-alpha toroid [Penicillium occitanis (nom. inval.)]PCG90490.1 hypothetical protein PENOC_101810 [Penicillium occitanis (nom. inval.)]
MATPTLNGKAQQIVAYLVSSLDTPYRGSSSMTPAIYDTAWLAMILKKEKKDDGESVTRWLFPRCLQSILDSQRLEGGFGESSAAAQADQILNTMVGILTLIRVQRNPEVVDSPPVTDLVDRIDRGHKFLEQLLGNWDITSTVHVGFEILIPTLFNMLEAEGLKIDFPGMRHLMQLNRQKLDNFKPASLYTPVKTTLLHSLEAFIGQIDFDNVTHHLAFGSMMGSPSSTAAYLMNASKWNTEAEGYLHFIEQQGNGSVPSAFPISVFECSWVLSTLLESGFTTSQLGETEVSRIADFLETELAQGNGLAGFAPGMLPDADDTAKAIVALRLLNRPVTSEKMIEAFETTEKFKTYLLETTTSISANCNVLKALLYSEGSTNTGKMLKVLEFVCQTWYDGTMHDKWNIEPQYSMMLIAEALTLFLKRWDVGDLWDVPHILVSQRIPIVTFEILVRTLSSQSAEGSWKTSPEITAYALLTLKSLASLPWCKELEVEINYSINRGTRFLGARESKWNVPESVWIEKVTYGSAVLSETYCLAALRACRVHTWGHRVSDMYQVSSKKVDKTVEFCSKLPILSDASNWMMKASTIEAYLFIPGLLQQIQLEIFPEEVNKFQSKYLDYIPLAWTICNNTADFGLSTRDMWDMMVVSVLNFQVDRFMETVTGRLSNKKDFDSLKSCINQIFDDQYGPLEVNPEKRRKVDNLHKGVDFDQQCEKLQLDQLTRTKDILRRFISYVLNHPRVSRSCEVIRGRIRKELQVFLQSHVTQGEESAMFIKFQGPKSYVPVFKSANNTYYDWVRTTSANHTSCPWSFEFFSSVMSPSESNCFAGAVARYLAQDLCRHLATMCRQYNDYGSIARDAADGNLNSVNFPEFDEGRKDDIRSKSKKESKRETLFRIADYERECLDLVIKNLKAEVTSSTWKMIQVFINVTDLFGQIYVVRDINSSSS